MRTLDRLQDRFLRLLLGALRDELVIRHGPGFVSLVLYGSRARGDARSDSDIDLLLVADQPRQWDGLAGVRSAFESSAEYRRWVAEHGIPTLDVVPLTRTEAEQSRYLYLDMVEEAVFVHDQEDFMRRRLERLGERLRALGSYRAWLADGSYLWILKPGFRLGDIVEF